MREVVTVTGEVERVTFENEATGFRVLRLTGLEGELGQRTRLTVVGSVPAMGPGSRVRVSGYIEDDPRHGEQLRATAAVIIEPASREGMERYLASGILPGIGPALAQRIVGSFGTETLTVLDTQPERLLAVPGIGARRVAEVRKAWNEHRAEATTRVLLQQHGISGALAQRVIRRYAERTASIIQQEPYRLALEVAGVGFLTADRIARAVGIGPEDIYRLQAGALHELRRVTEQGHVCLPRIRLGEMAAQALGVSRELVEVAIDSLFAQGRIQVDEDRLYPAPLYEAEKSLAQALLERQRSQCAPLALPATWSERELTLGLTLAPEQRAALLEVLRAPTVIITGGPGVGKTTLVSALVRLLGELGLSVRLAAPTGRAAKRLAEATGRNAVTLHRLLEFEPRSGRFGRDADNPLEEDLVLVDESSMVDLPLAASLLCALRPSTRLVLVGDSEQLPSVGPGAVLRDIIASQVVPVVRLTHVFRQGESSQIIENAHRIRVGETPRSPESGTQQGDFFVVERRDPERAARDVIELVASRIPARWGFDPRSEIQVLCPMHRGPAGTHRLNLLLQQALNPGGEATPVTLGGLPLRVGDKVMQTRNDYEREIFNGDVGWVQRVDTERRLVLVTFESRVVEYDPEQLDGLVPAYAVTVHKSQGSEYPVVVVPLLTSHYLLLSRNLLYTAVTRARRLCVLVADPRALSMALSPTRHEERATFLAQRLARPVAEPSATC